MPSKETNHVGLGLKLLIEQFKATVDLPKYLSVYLRRFQDLENVTWDIINKRLLVSAVGDQLDMLGDLVGEGRLGRSDTDYRSAIGLRIRVNRSQGRAEDIIDVADLASAENAEYYEYYPAGFAVEIFNATSPTVVARMLYATKSAGTGGALVFTNWATLSDVFRFDSAPFPIAGNVFTSAVVAPTERFPAALVLSPNLGGSIQTFAPGEMPQLEVWLKADAGLVFDSGHVATWQDQSGHGRNFSASGGSAGPYYNATGINGLPALEWINPGDPDELYGPSLLFPASEVFVVKKADGATAQGLWTMGSDASGDLHPNVDTTIYDDFASTTRRNLGASPHPMTTPHIYNARSGPKYWQADYNGVNFSAVASNTVGWGSPVLGRNAVNTAYTGKIAELLIFSRILDAAERLKLTNYLTAKYTIVNPIITVTVTAISPNVGFRLGAGLPVTITGTGFVSGCTVSIDGVACTSVVFVNSTTLTVVTGTLGSEGVKSATVINPDTSAGTGGTYRALASNLWLRARQSSDYVLDGSSKVATWTDLSGTGNSLVSAGSGLGPAIDSTGFTGGVTSVRMTAAGQALTKASFSAPSAAEAFVVKRNNQATADQGLWILGSSGVQDWVPAADTMVYDSFGSTARKTAGTPPNSLNFGHIYNPKSAAGAWSVAMNSQSDWYSTATNTVGFPSTLTLGKNFIASTFDGWIGEVLMFPRVLTTAERADVNAYLTSSWTITNFALAPAVTAISPNVAFRLAAGSTAPYQVTITGTGFVSGCTVTIGGVAATSVVFVNSTTLTCYPGTHGSAGQKDVKVTNPDTQYGTKVNALRVMVAENWHRGDVGTITNWTDLSDSGNHLVSGVGASSISSTGVGSKPAYVFNGSTDYIRGPCTFNSANYTAYIVGKFTGATAGNQGVFTLLGVGSTVDNTNPNTTLIYRGGVQLNTYRNSFPLALIASGPGLNVDFGMRTSCDGTNNNLLANTTAATPVATTGATNVGEILFPCRYLAGVTQLFAPMNVAEIIIFGVTNPTTAEDTDIRAYLSARYGLTF